MKRKKILYLITGLNLGGAEMVLNNLVSEIDKDEFNIIVVSIRPIGIVGEKIKSRGIKVLELEKWFKYNPIIILKFIYILLKEKPDILHTHLFHANLLGRILGRICGVPVVISTFHESFSIKGIRKELLKITVNFSNLDIAVSKMLADEIIRKKVSISPKVQIIHNSIDIERINTSKRKGELRKELKIPQDVTVLISIGRLAKEKGYNYLVEAIYYLKSRRRSDNIILFIIGEGEERKRIEVKIKRLGLSKIVILLGEIEDISSYLHASDIFVTSSLHEGFSLATFEAVCAGLPVVSTKMGAVPEIIEDNKTGFLVGAGDSKALAEKIEYVLNLSKEERKKITKGARKVVEEKFSVKKMAKNYESLYRELLK